MDQVVINAIEASDLVVLNITELADVVQMNVLNPPSANAYTDQQVAEAVAAAEAHADTVAGVAQANAQTYADTVAGQAQAGAEAYADGVAAQAQTAAEAHADTVAALKADRAPRVRTIVSSATPSIDVTLYDCLEITGQATAGTISTSGVPANFQPLLIRVLDNGIARAMTLDSSKFFDIGGGLTFNTTANKTCLVGAIYNSTKGKYGVVSIRTEA